MFHPHLSTASRAHTERSFPFLTTLCNRPLSFSPSKCSIFSPPWLAHSLISKSEPEWIEWSECDLCGSWSSRSPRESLLAFLFKPPARDQKIHSEVPSRSLAMTTSLESRCLRHLRNVPTHVMFHNFEFIFRWPTQSSTPIHASSILPMVRSREGSSSAREKSSARDSRWAFSKSSHKFESSNFHNRTVVKCRKTIQWIRSGNSIRQTARRRASIQETRSARAMGRREGNEEVRTTSHRRIVRGMGIGIRCTLFCASHFENCHFNVFMFQAGTPSEDCLYLNVFSPCWKAPEGGLLESLFS